MRRLNPLRHRLQGARAVRGAGALAGVLVLLGAVQLFGCQQECDCTKECKAQAEADGAAAEGEGSSSSSSSTTTERRTSSSGVFNEAEAATDERVGTDRVAPAGGAGLVRDGVVGSSSSTTRSETTTIDHRRTETVTINGETRTVVVEGEGGEVRTLDTKLIGTVNEDESQRLIRSATAGDDDCPRADGGCEKECTECDDDDGKAKVTLCHVPPGNPANEHTITVGSSAVDAHLRNHGDYLGACDGRNAGAAKGKGKGKGKKDKGGGSGGEDCDDCDDCDDSASGGGSGSGGVLQTSGGDSGKKGGGKKGGGGKGKGKKK